MPQLLDYLINGAAGDDGADGADGADGHSVPGGRLTLATADPLPTADQTAKTTVYYTPYLHGQITLYSGSEWVNAPFTEKSIAVPSTTNTPFDVFGQLSLGTLALGVESWTNDTTRATGLARQDGRLVKSGAPTQVYLGTCRTTGSSGQCEDSQARRLVWNMYNRFPRLLRKTISATGYTYSTATFRAVNADSTFRVDWVAGLNEALVDAKLLIFFTNSAATFAATGAFGLDSTTAFSGVIELLDLGVIGAGVMSQSRYLDRSAIGYHFLQALERGAGSGTQTWFNGSDRGIIGTILA